ncbi:hypothetical protein ACP70R_038637 [Stipagrostis hirtigluma subsp. patula]
MIDSVNDNVVLEKCVKDILALIKPVEDDRNKRLSAITELENCMHSVAALRGAVVKPFGSFVSDLYSNSGDLDLSVQLWNGSNLPINKKKKQNVLRDVRRALLTTGVAGYMQFIPHARVPVLQYMSNRFGISCDISIDNYAGRIKSKIFYWVNTLDERFGDMVLLIKEWAKAQSINDPKLKPPILPPLKEIYEGNIAEDITEGATYNEEHLDEVCATNITRFRLQNMGQRNESSLCHLLATFFRKFIHINALPDNVISTYTGQLERIQDNPSWMTKSYHLFVEDPVERPDNAARAVSMGGLRRIAGVFNDAYRKFDSLELIDRNELLKLLCTPGVGSQLGVRVIANSYTNAQQRRHQQTRTAGRTERDQRPQEARGFRGSRPAHKNPQVNNAAHQIAGQYQNRNHPQVHTTVHQTARSYQNRNHPQTYTAVHQTSPYQDHNHPQPQVYPAWLQIAAPYQDHNQQVYAAGFQTAGAYQGNQVHTAGFQTAGTYQHQNQQGYTPGFQTAGPYHNQQWRKEYTSNHQTNRHAVRARYEPVRAQFYNGSTLDLQSQASNSAASQR